MGEFRQWQGIPHPLRSLYYHLEADDPLGQQLFITCTLEPPERDPLEPFDHAGLLTPVRAISAPISGSDSCVPASSHHPVTRWQASVPASA